MIISIGKIKIQLNLVVFVLYVVMMFILISLGKWQLSRADEKFEFLASRQRNLDAPEIKLDLQQSIDSNLLRYRKVTLAGEYDLRHQILVDNQIHEGKPGFLVMTPLKVKNSGYSVLINRGWVPWPATRSQIPDVTIAESKVEIVGRINRFPSVALKLTGAEEPTETWPAIVQVINAEIISSKIGYPLVDFQIELSPQAKNGYVRNWNVAATISPEKHKAYAIQWFSLAVVMTILFIWYSCRSK